MPVEAFGLTNTGKVRANNEDAFAIGPDLSLALVADGMGGENCGEVASALTVEAILSYLHNPGEPSLAPEELLKEAVRSANRKVWEATQSRGECKGMGSTVVIAHWRERSLWIVNVGDSRAYLWRGGSLRQLSYDQNVGNDLRHNLGLTEEQIRRYPHTNVLTMAVGVAPDVLIRCQSEPLARGDVVLLCSDGLYGPVGDSAIAGILTQDQALPAAAEALIQLANSAGGPDNITAVMLRYAED
jgi:serine/threonine protein phosphatase PrpC